jgi:hypothetical protein
LSQTARFYEIAFGMNRLHESGKRCKVEKYAGTLTRMPDEHRQGASPTTAPACAIVKLFRCVNI